MGKERKGGNKSETRAKARKNKRPKKTMADEKGKARDRERARILKAAIPNKTDFEASLRAAPKAVKKSSYSNG